MAFDDFFESALDQLVNDPFKTRVILKYQHKNSRATIRLTDGKKTLISKLKEKSDFEKLEKFIQIVSKILSNSLEDEP